MTDAWTLLAIPVRVIAVVLGAFLVLQGFTTAGFLGIVGLFAGESAPLFHLGALILFGFALLAAGAWLVYGGVRNFPYVTRLVRERTTSD